MAASVMTDSANNPILSDPALLTEQRICPGCKLSVVTENGGVVVAFGQSYFHIDCFKCAKCSQQVTADTNLLLLSDGSPVCANCSYCCNVCGLPILDEAIMTGDDSYHAHCFNCKVCKKRIDELVFAKTSQGIYCMPCHNERVARSRRHQEKRDREKREREKKVAAVNTASVPDAGSSRTPQSSNKVPQSNSVSRPSTAPAATESLPTASIPSAKAQNQTPRTSEFAPSVTGRSPTQQPGSAASERSQPSSARPHTSSAAYPATPSNAASMAQQSTPIPSAKRVNTMQFGLPASPSVMRDASNSDHARGNTQNRSDSLGVPEASKALHKRRSFDDRPLNMLVTQNLKPDAPPSPTTLLSPEGAPVSRKDKRRSINPLLVPSFNSATPPSTTPSTPTASGTPALNRASSPMREQFPAEVSLSPPSFTTADTNHSPHVPRMQLDTSDTTLNDRQFLGRSRSASSSDTPQSSPYQQPSRSPLRLSITLDRVPARTSSRTDLRSDTAPASFHPDERSSPSLYVPNGGNQLTKQRSFENRNRNSSSSLGMDLAQRPRSSSTSRPTSPAHRADVPHSIESGTDTEAEGEERTTVRDSVPPLPPPKEPKGIKAGLRPPQLKLDTSHVGDEDYADISQIDSEGVSEDLSHEEEPVESTSHSTFIAPALPPIRFSMSGTDFAELLKSVGGQEGLKALDRIAEGNEGRSTDVSPTPPPTAAQPTTPTNSSSPDTSIDATPVRRPNGSGRSSNDIPRNGMQRSQSTGRHNRPARPAADDIRTRQRVDSAASLPPNGATDRRDQTQITVTSPDNMTTSFVRSDTSELIRRRLQEALKDCQERGANYVKIDTEFLGAIMMLVDQQREDFQDIKRKLDGMKRASQQYMDGLSVASTEYDKELKARREAEAEVTRLRVLLSGQAVRLTAITGETRRQEAQKQLSQQMSDSLSSLERDLSKLKVERDMTLAEVEELSASKSSSSLASNAADEGARLSRALSVRFDSIKNQYQGELLPLTAQKEALYREITELKASRDAFLEETTMLNARNEELAQLNAQYMRRMETMSDNSHEYEKRDTSLDKSRPANLNASVTSSTTAFSDESGMVKVTKPDASEMQPIPVVKKAFGWGSKTRAQAQGNNRDYGAQEQPKAKPRAEHSFQQVSALRPVRCEHCGDKMWGSLLRCLGCNIAVHTRCAQHVHLSCSQQGRDELVIVSGPTVFGRELSEQVRADSKDGERLIPVIVEKCIDAVDTLALDYEGIYRKTGGLGQSKMITQLFERGDYASIDLKDMDRFNDISSVTSVLKTYFRSLPDPLMTFDLHDKFMAAATNMKDPAMKGAKLQEAVDELPREHYYTVRALMLHLHRVSQHSEQNRMDPRNLGVVFGPTLMRSRDPSVEFADMAGKSLSVEWLIENAPAVFDQPSSS